MRIFCRPAHKDVWDMRPVPCIICGEPTSSRAYGVPCHIRQHGNVDWIRFRRSAFGLPDPSNPGDAQGGPVVAPIWDLEEMPP